MWEQLAIIAAQYIVGSAMDGGQQGQQQPQSQLGFQPLQAPQPEPFQPMGLPQQPQYGQTPPAITQFSPFQPLFPRRRLGE